MLLPLMCVICYAGVSANDKSVDAIRQRVEEMRQVDYEHQNQILTLGLQAAIDHAHSIFNICEDDTWVGFDWNAYVMDVCGDEPSVNIGSIMVIDGNHANVAIRYVDQPCYDVPYTLNLLWEDGCWKIDDVYYPEQEEGWATLRAQCHTFYDIMVHEYMTESADDILDNMLSMEPLEEYYTDPSTIYSNPKEVQLLIEQINNGHELFKKNPGYTPSAGKRITEMVNRIKRHL